jgi:TRAP-type mannitol/chloroaromatic compound transport system permease small subunit
MVGIQGFRPSYSPAGGDAIRSALTLQSRLARIQLIRRHRPTLHIRIHNQPLAPTRFRMNTLLAISRIIDAINERVGRATLWLVLVATLISAGNALMRYTLNLSSNAWLEVQWYLFAALFLLAAGYTLKHNGHVRIDVLYGHLSARAQAWIDLVGGLLFLLPFSLLMVWLSWPGFTESLMRGEVSPDAGGLLRWPVRLMIPLGFALLGLQGVSEIIKRIAVLRGVLSLTPETPRENV